MDQLITFIKKEEPVEYVLTTDDQGKNKDEQTSVDMTVYCDLFNGLLSDDIISLFFVFTMKEDIQANH